MFNCGYNTSHKYDRTIYVKDDLAIVEDDVYLLLSESSKDDDSGESETSLYELDNEGEVTTPTLRAAQTTPPQADLRAVMASVATELHVDVASIYNTAMTVERFGRREMMDCATYCAQVVMAVLNAGIQELARDDQRAVIRAIAPTTGEVTSLHDFWYTLNGMLQNYLWSFTEPGWVALPGIGDPGGETPWMPVWEDPDGYIVCDVVTGWDDEEILGQQMGAAIRLAVSVFGDRVGGVRLVPPLGFYMARWYHPDESWEPLFEVPGFFENGQPV